jgi:hypothetical protein
MKQTYLFGHQQLKSAFDWITHYENKKSSHAYLAGKLKLGSEAVRTRSW